MSWPLRMQDTSVEESGVGDGGRGAEATVQTERKSFQQRSSHFSQLSASRTSEHFLSEVKSVIFEYRFKTVFKKLKLDIS